MTRFVQYLLLFVILILSVLRLLLMSVKLISVSRLTPDIVLDMLLRFVSIPSLDMVIVR